MIDKFLAIAARLLVLALSVAATDTNAAEPPAKLAQAAPPARAQTALDSQPDTRRFAFQRLDVDQSGLQPRVCVQVTRALRAEGVRCLDYVTVTPKLRPAAAVDGNGCA